MVAHRSSPKPTDAELAKGIPLFVDQIIETLRVEQTSERGWVFTIDLPRLSI